MVIVMSIVFTNQNAFNKTYTLTNTAYDLALTLRGTETFGLGSRAVGTTVNAGYGLHFVSGTQNSIIFFADTSPAASCSTPDCKSGDYVYTSGSDAVVQTYTLGNSITIKDFCTYNGNWTCTYAHNGYSAGDTSMDIVFARPNPNPFISVNGVYSSSFPVTMACITLSSTEGTMRYVSVSSSGEITANTATCP
jgi:hypothetical protein